MKHKIKILFTIPNFKTAGSKYVLFNIYKSLDRTVFQPYVLVEKFPETIPKLIPKEEQLVLPNIGNDLQYITSLKNLLKQYCIAIVHSWDYRSSSLEAIACILANVKYVYTKKNNAWSKRWFIKSLLSTKVVYNNPEMLERFFSHFLLKKKVNFIPHGVDTNLFKPKAKVEDERQDIIIGCIGVIGVNKNQLFIVEALKDLPTNFKVHFYGQANNDYLADLKSFIKQHKLVDRVVFKGVIVNELIPDVMHDFDVLVLASKQEGLPLCLLEAMACGVPVLSSDSGGGARYLLKEGGGFIFNLNTTDQLVDQLNMIATNPAQHERLSKEGLKNVETHFQLKTEVLAYQTLFKKLLKVV